MKAVMPGRTPRILTGEEERRLLEACSDDHRAQLRPIIIAAIDTGMRRGEILSLRWREIDLESGIITLRDTKTVKVRELAMTTRLKQELARLYEQNPHDAAGRVFGVLQDTYVQRSFAGARKDAGLTDVLFYDLRHTAATRLLQAQRKGGQPKAYRTANAASGLEAIRARVETFYREREAEEESQRVQREVDGVMAFFKGYAPDFITEAVVDAIWEACALTGVEAPSYENDHDDESETRAILTALFSKTEMLNLRTDRSNRGPISTGAH